MRMEAAITTESTTHRQPVPRLALSVPEAAAALGLSPRSVWQLIADGALPVRRVGKRVLVPTAELAAFIAADTHPTHQEQTHV